ncbi:hypothetical protein ACMFMG_003120 [Clarireedia jacksonii]
MPMSISSVFSTSPLSLFIKSSNPSMAALVRLGMSLNQAVNLVTIPGVTVVLSTLLRNRDQDACTEKVSQQIQSLMGVYENARIGLADIRSVMSMNDLSSDGTHPNYGGYKLFAGVWWNAISRLENNIQPPATVTGMNDAMVDSSKTCKKVAGNAGAAVQSQLGSGHDDGNYVHDSSAHGALESAQINKNSDP